MTENVWSWRKSSFSEPNGNNCVELGWRKSSFSEANGNSSCVELPPTLDAIRDSKNAAILHLPTPAITALLHHVRADLRP